MAEAIDEDRGGGDVEEIDEGAADIDREHEHQVHDHQEDGDAQGAVEDDPVDVVRRRLLQLRRSAHGRRGQSVHEVIASARNQRVGVGAEPRFQASFCGAPPSASRPYRRGRRRFAFLQERDGEPAG